LFHLDDEQLLVSSATIDMLQS